MNLYNFLSFNHTCPVCGEPLSLFLQIEDVALFSGKLFKDGVFYFNRYLCTNSSLAPNSIYMFQYEDRSNIYFRFSNTSYLNNGSAYLFFICNTKSINTLSFNDFEIMANKSCYYRQSPKIEISKDFFTTNESLINNKEVFSLFYDQKTYVISINHDIQNMYFARLYGHGSDFKMFEKFLPIPTNTLDFTNKSALINKFDNWILMS